MNHEGLRFFNTSKSFRETKTHLFTLYDLIYFHDDRTVVVYEYWTDESET